MDYKFNEVNLESKKKFDKKNRILIALAIFALFFILYQIANINSISFTSKNNFSGKNSQNTFSKGDDFSYHKKPSVPVPQEISLSAPTLDSSAPTNEKSQEESSIVESAENFIFGEPSSISEELPETLLLENNSPKNLILIVIDAGGASYISPEQTPNILALSKFGFSSKELQVRFPSTTESHTTILTGIYNESYDWTTYPQLFVQNKSLFTSAKSLNYTILAIMGKGDSPQLINKTDAALHDSDNNFHNLKSNLHLTHEISPAIAETFSTANNLSAYENNSATPYISYNNWIKDSVKETIRTLASSGQKFILVVNFPGLDEAGHENFDGYYLQTFHEADKNIGEIFKTLLETNLLNSTAFVVTADHGMQKSKRSVRGAHADTYNDLTLKVPLLLISPSIQPHVSESLYFNDDITPTLLKLLNLPQTYNTTGVPIEEIFLGENFIDIGIKNLSYNSSELNLTIKNFVGHNLEDGVCVNVTDKEDYAVSCSNLTLAPFEQKTLLLKFPFSEPGIYGLHSYLTFADSNARNDELNERIKVGQIHDLGIESVDIEKENVNPQKINVKVRVLNYGDYPENSLEIAVTINNATRKYGPYTTNEIKTSKTISSAWTLNQTGEVQITAKLTNYTNFDLDEAQENNIKTTSVHIG